MSNRTSETQQENPYEEMTWGEYLWKVRRSIIGISAMITVYVSMVYVGSIYFPDESLQQFYWLAILFALWAALRIIGIKHGVTSEDIYR